MRAGTSRSTASGRATRSRTSCSAIRARRRSGIGRADEHGRSTWLHVYGQDDWKIRSNLTLNYGLRYEINSQMTDVDNRLSAIDLSGNALRDRERRRTAISSPTRAAAAVADSDPLRDVEGRRVDARAAASELSALRAARGRRLGAGQNGEDRRQRRLRRLPESVGLQRAAGARLDAAVLLREDGHGGRRRRSADAGDIDRAARARRTARSAATRWTGTSGPSTRRTTRSPSSARSRRRRWSKSASCARRSSAPTAPRCATCRSRARADRSAPADPAAGQHHGDSLGRLLDLQRRHVPGGAAAVARAGVLGVLHAVEGDRRCVGSRGNGVRSQPAAGRAEHGGRRGARQLRPPASLRRQRHLRAAERRRRERARVDARHPTGRSTASSCSSRVRRSR